MPPAFVSFYSCRQDHLEYVVWTVYLSLSFSCLHSTRVSQFAVRAFWKKVCKVWRRAAVNYIWHCLRCWSLSHSKKRKTTQPCICAKAILSLTVPACILKLSSAPADVNRYFSVRAEYSPWGLMLLSCCSLGRWWHFARCAWHTATCGECWFGSS